MPLPRGDERVGQGAQHAQEPFHHAPHGDPVPPQQLLDHGRRRRASRQDGAQRGREEVLGESELLQHRGGAVLEEDSRSQDGLRGLLPKVRPHGQAPRALLQA